MFEDLRAGTDKPICLSWLSPPAGITQRFAARGIVVFDEHARADPRRRAHRPLCGGPAASHPPRPRSRACRSAGATSSIGGAASRSSRRTSPRASSRPPDFRSRRGRLARTTEEAVRAAAEVGYPGRAQGDLAAITHRAAAGLVKLGLEDDAGVEKADRAFRARAAELGVTLDGIWVQHMVAGNLELLVTAFRDPQFGVMVGCGMGGAHDRDHRRRGVRARADRRRRRVRSDRTPAHDRAAAGASVRRRNAAAPPNSSRGSRRWSRPRRGRASPSRSIPVKLGTSETRGGRCAAGDRLTHTIEERACIRRPS